MNFKYSIYDKDSGEVLRLIEVPDDEHARLQLIAGEGLIKLNLDPDKQYVIDGKVKQFTPEEIERKKNPPSIFHTWDMRRRRYEDKRPAADVKEHRRQKIKDQIQKIEDGQGRALREAALGDTSRLTKIQHDIVVLRDQLAAI